MNYITNQMLLELYFDNKLLDYLVKKLSSLTRQEVVLRVCEVLKFLYFGNCSKGQIPFNDELDDIWHLLILQTKQYQELTYKLPHKKFVHHSSDDYDLPLKLNEEQQKAEKNRLVSYLVSYVHNFGPLSEDAVKFYSIGLALLNICNNDIMKLNEYLFDLGSKSAAVC